MKYDMRGNPDPNGIFASFEEVLRHAVLRRDKLRQQAEASEAEARLWNQVANKVGEQARAAEARAKVEGTLQDSSRIIADLIRAIDALAGPERRYPEELKQAYANARAHLNWGFTPEIANAVLRPPTPPPEG